MLQQPAKAGITYDLALGIFRALVLGTDHAQSRVPDSLVRSIIVVIGDVLGHDVPQVSFTLPSDVAQLYCFAQAGERVAGRDELVSHVAAVSDLHQLSHDGRIVDFLLVV